MRSRFASSGRLSSREIDCVKRRCSGIRCSIRFRIGGSATGVLITDNCHDTVRRWEQCAPGTSAAPEQKVRQNKKLTGRLAARDGPSDLAALTCAGAALGACVGKRWYQLCGPHSEILAFVRLRPRSHLMAPPIHAAPSRRSALGQKRRSSRPLVNSGLPR